MIWFSLRDCRGRVWEWHRQCPAEAWEQHRRLARQDRQEFPLEGESAEFVTQGANAMSLTTMLTDVCNFANLPVPSTFVSSTDGQIKQLISITHLVAKEIRDRFAWPQLTKEYSFATVNGTASYALPGDFERWLARSQWDRTNHWEVKGPLTPQEWQFRKSAIVSTGPWKRFRVKGQSLTQFFIDPTPGSADTVVFEYQSHNWIRPVTWTTATAFAANSYCFYNGNIYKTTAGGTTGGTPPTHTSGSASDGVVTWTYQTSYPSFLADTDTSAINETGLGYAILSRLFQHFGFDYLPFELQAQGILKQTFLDLRGTRTLNEAADSAARFIGPNNVPETGFGV